MAESEKSVKIGYEYARFITNEEQQIELHLLEPDDSDLTPRDDPESLVATSAEVVTDTVRA